jgi:FlaA1/EpsC-like NDP-sugar epimerase
LRPGEKLYEELLADADETVATPVRQLRVAKLQERSQLPRGLLAMAESHMENAHATRLELGRAVPEFRADGQN